MEKHRVNELKGLSNKDLAAAFRENRLGSEISRISLKLLIERYISTKQRLVELRAAKERQIRMTTTQNEPSEMLSPVNARIVDVSQKMKDQDSFVSRQVAISKVKLILHTEDRFVIQQARPMRYDIAEKVPLELSEVDNEATVTLGLRTRLNRRSTRNAPGIIKRYGLIRAANGTAFKYTSKITKSEQRSSISAQKKLTVLAKRRFKSE